MNIRTIQVNDPIQCKILFWIGDPDIIVIATILSGILGKRQSSIGLTLHISCKDGVEKSNFVT